jgi:RNA polymerase sigma-70 factor (ECF subfamily)
MTAMQELTSLHVARAAGGDLASQAWVVERFTPVLAAQARYRLQGPLASVCDPADVVQDVWAIALPRLADLRARDGQWTPVVLRFLATTLLRRVNHLARKHLAGGRPLPGEGDERIAELHASITGVVTRIQRGEVADAVHAALARLPEQEREVVVLRGIEQLSNRAVAEQLGVEDHVVTRRYQRGLEWLKQALPQSVIAEL